MMLCSTLCCENLPARETLCKFSRAALTDDVRRGEDALPTRALRSAYRRENAQARGNCFRAQYILGYETVFSYRQFIRYSAAPSCAVPARLGVMRAHLRVSCSRADDHRLRSWQHDANRRAGICRAALIGAVSLVDEPLYNATKSGASPARDAFFARVTHLGDGLAALALSAALWPHDRDTAQLVVNAGLRVGVASVVLKSIISRARPYEDAADCAPYRFGLASCVSMPSGHTATAFSMAHVLAHQYPKQSWL